MTKAPGIALYNQDRFGDADFIANFVARKGQAEALLNGLRHIAEGGPTEHQILVGARGMGKTSLLRRLAIGVMDDPDLKAHFIPLRFREEQYNIISLDGFWRNCGESLAEWCEQQGNQALADRLDIAIETPAWRDDDQARDGFLAACKEAGGRAILMLDNLDLILEGIKDQGCWSLRAALQKKGGPIVIGAATQLLVQGADRDAPFYEFFNPHMLEPLTERELLTCLNALATQRGEAGAPVKAILAREPERVRALYVLTGGNPRILGLVYGLLEQADSDEIFADLEALLDQVTPFYKARIEEYATPLQRAVIDGIALNWDPITSGALSRQSGIEATTLSAQLGRLRKDGLIEEVATSGSRAGYQLAERFLNIWYLMRHGTRKTKQRLRWFTIFLTKLFSAEELERMAGDARRGAGRWHPDHREAVIEAFKIALRREAESGDQSIGYAEAFVLFEKAYDLGTSGRAEEAICTYDDLIERFGDHEVAALQISVATALFNKGCRLGALGRSEDELAIYDDLISRFIDSNLAVLQELVAMALLNKGRMLSALSRSEDAIAIYDDLIARFGDSDVAALQELVAKALINKGFRLGVLGRSEDRIASCVDLIARFGDGAVPSLQAQVAMAQNRIGAYSFWDLGREDEGIASLRRAIKSHPDNVSPKANLLWTHIAQGRVREAEALLLELDALKGGGRALLLAGIDLSAENFGSSVAHLGDALAEGLSGGGLDFDEDLLWYLRIATERGYGERMIAWFAESGNADRYAPIYGALIAHVRGERFLLDLNPEVRGVAQPLYTKLSAGKRHGAAKAGGKGRKGKAKQ